MQKQNKAWTGAATLRYTYKDECLISDKSDLHGIMAVLVFACIDVLLFFAAIGFYVWKDSDILFLLDGITLLITAGMGWSVCVSIQHRRRPALARRRAALTEGTRCTGKIVNAGTEIESEPVSDPHDTRGRIDPNEYDSFQNCYRRVPNHWIDVAYADPQNGQPMRAHASHMVRGMEHLIGRDVNVYVRQVWADCLGKYLPTAYIDTAAL